MTNNRILALDQSSRTTGWAIFNNGELEKYGKFDFAEKEPIERIYSLQKEIKKTIDKEDINFILLEDIQLQANNNNVATYKVLAFAMAAILLLCLENNIEYEIIGSSTWKSVCGIKGRARAEQKRNAQAFVQETFEIKAVQDIVDAICIGYSYIK